MLQRFLENRKLQKLLLPVALVCILPIWLMLRKGITPIPVIVYVLGAVAAVCFIADRILKPYELERAEKQEAESRRIYAESREAGDNSSGGDGEQ